MFHQTTIARIEAGSRPVKLDAAIAIAGSLDVDLTSLVNDQDAMTVQRPYQAAMRTRDKLVALAATYIRRQISLTVVLEASPDALQGMDAAEASTITRESPGDVAMEGVIGLAAAAEMYSYEEYRELALQSARGIHQRHSRKGTTEALGEEGETDA